MPFSIQQRRAMRIVQLLLLLMFTPAVTFAQTTMTFAPASCATGLYAARGYRYTENGFVIQADTAPFLNHNLAAPCADGVNYAGPALLVDALGSYAHLSRITGTPFTLNSIDLGGQFFAGFIDSFAVTFTGNLAGGGQVFQTFAVNPVDPNTFAFQTFNFDPSFTDLTSVDFAQGNIPSYQFTNIRLDDPVTATPEPASMMLMATGLAGAAGMARRKLKARSDR
jgi:hypothetical protein